MDQEQLRDAALRLIKSECRLCVLRSMPRLPGTPRHKEVVPLELEISVGQRLWEQWGILLNQDPVLSTPQGLNWLRSLLLQVKIDAMDEVSNTLGGHDLSSFDRDFSVDRMLRLLSPLE
jgi:hypothetical protein